MTQLAYKLIMTKHQTEDYVSFKDVVTRPWALEEVRQVGERCVGRGLSALHVPFLPVLTPPGAGRKLLPTPSHAPVSGTRRGSRANKGLCLPSASVDSVGSVGSVELQQQSHEELIFPEHLLCIGHCPNLSAFTICLHFLTPSVGDAGGVNPRQPDRAGFECTVHVTAGGPLHAPRPYFWRVSAPCFLQPRKPER